VATATGNYYEATEFVESSLGSNIYIFWHNLEEASWQVDWLSNSSMAVILQLTRFA
jgi:hypothetical protein